MSSGAISQHRVALGRLHPLAAHRDDEGNAPVLALGRCHASRVAMQDDRRYGHQTAFEMRLVPT